MAHYMCDGRIVGWGPTVEEINSLSSIFDEIVHIGCLHNRPAPPSALPYANDRIKLIGVPASGGKNLKDKLGILKLTPLYLKVMLRELSRADIVHVRCPANIPLLAIILLAFIQKPKYRWVKYAGNWQSQEKESWSYTFQRWWLKKGFHRGVVTINGEWPKPKHVFSFVNPCLTETDVTEAREISSIKELSSPYKFLFVGAVTENKGIHRALRVARVLKDRGLNFTFDVIGDGPVRKICEEWASANGLSSIVNFLGWVPKPQLAPYYAKAHFLLFPTRSEGWAKVIGEAMAHGVVPLTSAVSCIPQMFSKIGGGIALPPNDINAFVHSVIKYIQEPQRWKSTSKAGIRAAPLFTYEYYLGAVRKMFQEAWGVFL